MSANKVLSPNRKLVDVVVTSNSYSTHKPGKGDKHQANDDEQQAVQIHDIVGHFGNFQLLVFMFKILIGCTSAFNNLGISFHAPNNFVGHWCRDQSTPYNNTNLITPTNFNSVSSSLAPGYLDIFQDFLGNSVRNEHHNWSNFTSKTPIKLRRECIYYPNENSSQSIPCKSYQYDTGIWISTIIDEWGLVCDKSWMISMTQSLYMSGFILAYPVFGYMSDRFGRWNSLLIGACIEMASGFGCAFSRSIGVYMFFRFLIGFGNAGRTSSSYLVMIEWVGPKWRMEVSTLGALGWVAGYTALPWLTIFFLHFRHMQLFVCLYELLFILCLLWVPESPRWLLTHRRYKEARRVLLKAAKLNGLLIEDKKRISKECSRHLNNNNINEKMQKGQQFNENLTHISNTLGMIDNNEINSKKQQANGANLISRLETKRATHSDLENDQSGPLEAYTLDQFEQKFQQLVQNIETKEFTKNEDNLTFIDLMKWKNLRKYSIILFFIWAANSFVYYGIVLTVGGDNLFVSYTIAGLMELPSIAFTIVFMKYLPRSTSNLIIYSMCGLLCLLQIPLKYYKFTMLLQCCIMLAKLANSCAFTCVLYQTMELFPTSIRQTAYSSCSLAGRLGSIVAPFVKELAQKTDESVPFVLYAILSIIESLLIRLLPETKGSDLHDTLMEAEKFEGVDANEHDQIKKNNDSEEQNHHDEVIRYTAKLK